MKYAKKSLKFLPDEMYIKLYYRLHLHRKLNLKEPKSLNEKLQWMKLNYRLPIDSVVSDKILVRDYVQEKIGSNYLIPLFGTWDKFEQIDFEKLPQSFVLKCNHDSGGIVVCPQKEALDIHKAKKVISKSLNQNFYYIGREYQYKNIKPRILCEQYLVDKNFVPDDFKIYCFNGVPDCILVCTDRFKDGTNRASYYFFDRNWNFLPYNKGDKDKKIPNIKKPENLEEMFRIAEILAKDFLFSRIDLYNVNGKIYFGEITLSPNSGFDPDITFETDLEFGKKLHIPYFEFKTKNNGD